MPDNQSLITTSKGQLRLNGMSIGLVHGQLRFDSHYGVGIFSAMLYTCCGFLQALSEECVTEK